MQAWTYVCRRDTEMEISQSTATTTAPVAPVVAQDKGAISSDFETFLKMLTAQMQNQDPLNPIESSDYAVQLATFSGVEQQVRTNDLLKSMVGQMGLMGMSQLAGWVGMEARVAAPVHFDGTPISLTMVPENVADKAYLVVRDQNNVELERHQLDLSQDTITWAGVNSGGDPYAAGTYNFHVESFANGQVIGDSLAQSYAKVTEARNENGSVILVMEGGAEVPADQVSALRQAQ